MLLRGGPSHPERVDGVSVPVWFGVAVRWRLLACWCTKRNGVDFSS